MRAYIEKYFPFFPSAILLTKYYKVLQENDFMNNNKVMKFRGETFDYDDAKRIWHIEGINA